MKRKHMMTSTLGFSANNLSKFAVTVSLICGAIFCSTSSTAQLTVDEDATIATMTNLIQGSGVTITNMTVTQGHNRQVSSFTNTAITGNPLNVNQGVLLSTGRGNGAIGPNNSTNYGTNYNTNYNDPDLIALEPLATHDVVIVEFDVIPKTDTMQLTFQWGSEEYLEYTCSEYNDVFAFLVSGPGISGPYSNGAQNFAKLPDNTVVSIGTVNQGSAGQFGDAANCASLSNSSYFITNPTNNTYVQADGVTTNLRVKGVVTPCGTYHVKCVLADAGDNVYDSWVWLQGFEALGQSVTITSNITGQQLVEGCNTVQYRAHRIGDISVPITVTLAYSGTAIAGTDYIGAPSSITFPSGVDEVFFNITPTVDALVEGTETVIITGTWNICSEVVTGTYNFTIADRVVTISCPADITVNAPPGTCQAVVNYAAPTATDACGPCPAPSSLAGYTLIGTFNGHTYFKSNTNTSWIAAHSAAVSVGAHLVTITSAAENNWLAANTTGAAWIGRTDEIVEGTWRWVTGEPSGAYSNWCTGQPNNSGNQDYAVYNAGTGGCWDDLGTGIGRAYVIEFDCSMSQTVGLPSGSSFPVGVTTVTYQATNDYDTKTCSFNVTVVDTQTPTITCPSTQTLTLAAAGCTAPLPDYRSLATTTDNCTLTVANISQSPAVGTIVSGFGAMTVTLTVTDIGGNTQNCSFTVNKIDATNPTITCPAAQTLNLNASCAGTLGDYRSLATVADNCTATGSLTVTQSPAAGTAVSGVGTTVVTLTVTDAAGRTANCTFNVNRVDNTNPTITCPAAQTLNLNASCAGTLGDYRSLATVADNCTATGSLTVTQSPAAGTAVSGVGTTVVTLTVTDASGNTANCTFNVNRVDNTNPTITCPAAQTLNLNASCAGTLGDYRSLATVADNCTATGSLTVTQSPAAGTAVSGVGTTLVTLTVTDAAGRTANCTFNVNRVDNTNPTITCPAAQTLNLNASCAGTLGDYRSLATVADNCTATGSLTVTQSPAAGTAVSGVGTTVVTLTVTDASGNTANCTFNVNRVDNTNPTITCPAAQTLNLNASCAGTLGDYRSLATVADNCTATGSLTVTQSPAAGTAVSGVGTTLVTLTVTDAAGRTANCTFNVNRVDNTNPTITCPAAQTLNLNASCAGTLGDYRSLATVADNCTATGSLTVTQSPAAGTAVSGVGTTVVTLTVTDASGNTANCTFNVNRVDNTNPTITCPAAQTLNLNASCAGTLGDYRSLATVADNCTATGSLTVTQSPASGTAVSGVGTTLVTLTVTDAAGNTANCTFNVNRVDNTNPTITCPAAQTLNLNASCAGTLGDYRSLATVADNCTATGSLVVTQSPAAGTAVSGVGTTVVTLTVADAAGRTANCTFNVNRVDNTDPTITCPVAQTLNLNASCAGTLGDYRSLATVADNCTATGSLTVTQSPAAGTAVSGVGTTVVTLTVTDAAGRTANCTFNVNRVDNTNPTITCPVAQTLNLNASCAGTLGDYRSLATVADNCTATGSLVVTQSPAAGTAVSGVGTTVVTLTVTDAAGRTANCTFNVNRVDTTNPTITCPAAQTLNLNASCAGTLGDYRSLATVADNCTATGSLTVTQSPASGTAVSGVGTTVVTLTVTDAAGRTANCTFNVNRVDTTNPTITCPAAQTLNLNASCAGTLGDYRSLATVADNCTATGSLTVTQSPASGTAVSGVGTTVVTLTVTDAAGNTANCTFNVNRVDNTNPTITCPSNIAVNVDAASCVATVASLGTPVTADNCSVASVTNNHPSSTYPVGTTTVIWTVTDASGRTATCNQTITVTDNINPTITCPANINVNVDAASCVATVASLGTPVTADNCSVASVTNNHPSSTYPVGTTTVIWTVTDASGRTATCNQTVTVTDNINPTITCPAAQTLVLDASCSGVLGNYTSLATAADNCTVASVTQSPAAGTAVSGVGTTVVTLTVTDAAGNTSTCNFNVNRIDNIAPVITCPANQSVAFNNDCEYVLPNFISTLSISATDNCSSGAAITYVQSPAAGTVITTTQVVTVTATDASGNSSSCTFDVVPSDQTAPFIAGCPGNFDVDFNASCGYQLPDFVSSLGITLTDNCDPNPVYLQAPAAGTIINTPTTVVITIYDNQGNSSQCGFTITPVDTTNPTISCPANVSVPSDAGFSYATVATSNPTTGDNCSVASLTWAMTGVTVATGSGNVGTHQFNLGITTVTYTVTDAAGNTATCSYTVDVSDNQPPVVTCPANITVNVDAGVCNANVTVPVVTATDNEGIASITNNYNGGGANASGNYPVGTTAVTFTATDNTGNTNTCSITVTVVDNIAPVITCTSAITVNATAGACTASVTIPATTATDNCGVASITNNYNGGGANASGTYSVGTTTVVFTATDVNGNTSTCSVNVTVVDNQNPTITCPANISVNVDAASCVATVASLGTPVTADNCSVASVTNNHPSSTYPVGTTTVIWTVTDAAGNTATCNQTVTVTDNINPTITCPANITVNVDAASCVATVSSLGTPVTADNCSVASVTNNHPSSTYPVGTTTVIWTVTDAAGNTATCNQTVTVTDNINPTITCPANISVNVDAASCVATIVSLGTPTTADNCSVASVTNNHPSSTYPVGTTTVIWTVTDAAGNTATCNQTVTVTDNINPTITCPAAQALILNASCAGVLGNYTSLATAADNCTVASVTQSPAAGTAVSGVGTTVVTLTVTDAAGNTSTCNFNVNRIDNIAPVITCPANQSVAFNNDCEYVLPNFISTLSISATDNCSSGAAITYVQSPAAGTVITTTQVVTVTATDASGNSSSCTFDVVPSDQTAPFIAGCPGNFDVDFNASCGYQLPDFVSSLGITLTDNCDPNPVYLQAPAAGTIINTPTTVVITIYDNQGNSSQCGFTITPVDTTNPTISCPANVSVPSDAGFSYATVATSNPTTGDNCSVASLTWAMTGVTVATGSGNVGTHQFNLGITTVTYTVTDAAGNTATCSYTVDVSDNQPPVVTCPANITVNVDAGVCNANVTVPVVTATDNEGIASITNNYNGGGANASGNYPVGTTAVTFTATDNTGNTNTCSITVTVVDNIAPVITCTSAITVNATAGACTASVTIPATTATDNCGVASITNNYNGGGANASGTYSVGTTTVVFTATDVNGNTSTCSVNVTVVDNQNPTITCPANISVNVDAASCVATVASLGTPVTADNCSVASVTNNHPSSTYPVGTTTVIWTVTDAAGNTATCNQTVTVTDNINPTITCPANITVNVDAASCVATVSSLGTPVTADNCSVASVTNNHPSSTYPVGTTTVIWTVTDAAGNTATCNQTVTVTDNINPTITCPANISVNVDAASCVATIVSLGTPTTADNCSVASVTNNHPSSTYPVGTTTVIWTVTDAAGNTATCNQTVTVTDNINPTITCPAAQALILNASCAGVLGNYTSLATAADNCTVASVTQSPAAGTAVSGVGTTVVTLTVTDAAGNTSTCNFNVNRIDNIAPVITCPANQSVAFNNDCEYVLPNFISTLSISATDNCSSGAAITYVQSPAAGTVITTTQVVTVTATDASGNSSSCTFDVVPSDQTAPFIAGCPGNFDVDFNASCGYQLPDFVSSLGITLTDNCDPNPVYLQAPAAGTIINTPTTVVITIYDNQGNSSQCGFTITPVDTTNPTITCPADITQPSDINQSYATVTVPAPVVADNCGIASLVNDFTGTSNASGQYPLGTTTVTYTVTDNAGNTATCTFTVTVTDNQPPVVNCPSNITVNVDAGVCNANVTVPVVTATDNEGIASITNNYNGGGANASGNYPVGTTAVTFTATDNTGNTNTCSITVTVVDNIAPVITCTSAITVNATAGACTASVTIPATTATDNCGVASITNNYNGGGANASGTYSVGTTTVVFTATDVNGNTSTCSVNVTVVDNQNPTITCPANVAVNTDNNVCTANVTIAVPSTADNCGIASVVNDFNNTNNASGVYPVGTTTVTWTVTDIHSNVITCTQEVVVTDVQNPSITCPANVSVGTDAGLCTSAITIASPVTSDNCGVASVVNDFNNTNNASGVYAIGTTTIIWTVTDVHGNVSTCTQTVVVSDDEDPTITCPANQAVNFTNDCDFTLPDYTSMVTAADNCDNNLVLTQSPVAGTVISANTTVTITATDDAGNDNTCSFQVIITDNIDPVLQNCPGNQSVAFTNNCDYTLLNYIGLFSVSATDNCDATVSIVQSPAAGTVITTTQIVTIIATDDAGNTTACSFDVVPSDQTAPAISGCTGNFTVSYNNVCGFEIPNYMTELNIIIDDNCDGAPVVIQTPSAGTIINTPTLVSIQVWDNQGNSSLCAFTITPVDDNDPVITSCPSNQNVSADANCMFTMPDYTSLVVANDNCTSSLTVTQYPEAGSVVSGTTTVTMTVTDSANNSSDCSFQVIVIDNTEPIITTCAPDVTEQVGNTCIFQLPDYTSLVVATDNCDPNPVITQNPIAGTVVSGHGTVVPVTITVTDANGNNTTCEFDVTLEDSINPTITCPANLTVNNDLGLCTASVSINTPSTADNCQVVSIVNDFNGTNNASDIYPEGTTTITWTVTDIAGNIASCPQTITVIDNEQPVITCPADITVNNDANSCDALVTVPAITTNDNCGVDTAINSYNNTSDATDTYPVGTTNITWTVTDIHGNVSTCTQVIEVVDPELPTITCPANLTQTADAGVCEAAVTVPVPSVADNCLVDAVTNDYNNTSDASDVYPVGTTTITWTVTDIYGNAATCTMDVVVTDNEQPSITCPANLTSNNDLGVCEAFVTVGTPATADNCDVDTVINDYNNSANASYVYPVGTTTITWMVTDIHGNTNTCTQTVTVVDNEQPVITCPTDITVNNDANSCDALVTVPAITTNDNCGVDTAINSYNNTSDATDTYPVGTTTITWTVTDIHSNVSTCTQVIEVVDPELPTITCPANITQTADAGVCEAAVTVPAPSVADNCLVDAVTNDYNNTSDASDVYPVGTTTITWTVTDIYGNAATCTMDVVVTDNEQPSITCPANLTSNNDLGVCEAFVTVGTPATADNCDVDTVINDYNNSANASDVYPVGTTTITWTVTDIHGNTNTCTQDITVVDNEQPVITCPADITVNNDANSCDALVTVPAITTNDNCGVDTAINSYNNTSDATDTYPVGTTTITWTVTDIHGNVSTCTQTIEVVDPELPTITCPANITQTADAGVCEAAVTVPAPSVADNCLVDAVTNDYNNTSDASDVYPVGTTTITWTVTDIYGNAATCTMDVVVTDNELPTITCPVDVTQTTDNGVCEAFVTISSPVTTDNCDVASVVNDWTGTDDASAIYPEGTTIVLWTVTDIHGNENTCTQVITVNDEESPVITCPADIVVTTDAGMCEAQVVVPAITANDNCQIATIVNDFSNTDDASAVYPQGTTIVLWTATDIHGNVSICTQSITVNDEEAPAFTCPADVTVNNDAGSCGALVTIEPVSATDNCGIQSITNDRTNSDNATDTYSVGTTVITWTVTDMHGNISSCTQTIVVNDIELPTVVCPANVLQTADAGMCGAVVTIDAPVVADNCDIASVVNDYNNSSNASDNYPVGTTEIVWTVTDIHGNVATCTMSVEIMDNENPTITCPADITMSNDAGVCEALVSISVPSTADNCEVESVVNDYNNTADASGVYPVGTTLVTWTVTDIHGNVSTCSTTITIEDNELPVVTCPTDITVMNDEGLCNANVEMPALTGIDNCGIESIVNDYNNTDNASGVYSVGTTTVNWLITDIHGNQSTCVQTVTVEDNEAPVVTCPSDIEQTADAGLCHAFVTIAAPVVADNCEIESVVNNFNGTDNATDNYLVGTTLIEWTITDIHGNVTTCEMNVVVTDDELPVITCPENISVNTDLGVCQAQITVATPAVSDNCGVLSVINNFNGTADASGIYPTGITAVEWTVTDIHGNVNTCIQQVTVTDNEAPITPNCGFNIEVNNDEAQCGAIVTYEIPEATDNCSVVDSTMIGGFASGEFFPIGVTEVIYEFTDAAGNSTTCNFFVVVTDNEVPTITCTESIVVNNDPGVCGAVVNYELPQYVDNCDNVEQELELEMAEGLGSGELFPVGITTVNYQVTDAAGNISDCSFTVTVVDNELPVITCPESIEQIDPIVNYETPIFSDNCSATLTMIEGLESGDVFPHGYTTVTYVATDLAGNADTCSFEVLINTPPVAVPDAAEFLEEDDCITINLIGNDYDLDSDSISISVISEANGTATLNEDGTITYCVNTEEWCGTDSLTYVLCDSFGACDTGLVRIDVECYLYVIVPQGFSPNSDGTNDVFEIVGIEDYPNNHLAVFNRWGHKVYEKKGYDNSWNGHSEVPLTIGNGMLPKGTYFYILSLGDGTKPMKGSLFLNR